MINKPAGIEIHGKNSITEGVIRYLEGKIPESLSFRPGPLHRLDRNTSGIVAFGKSLHGAREFSRLLKSDGIEKYYIAILDGKIPDRGKWTDILSREGLVTRIDGNSRGKKGITSFKTLFSTGELSLVLFRLHTGRTHQIRAQAGWHGHSLSGDVKYGGSRILRHYCLHAWLIKSVENLPPSSG